MAHKSKLLSGAIMAAALGGAALVQPSQYMQPHAKAAKPKPKNNPNRAKNKAARKARKINRGK